MDTAGVPLAFLKVEASNLPTMDLTLDRSPHS